MKLLTRFTLIFLVVFGAGLALCGVVAYRFLRLDATDQVVEQARLMMQTMLAARTYTTKQVEPLLAGTNYGKGRVVVFTSTVLGQPAEGQAAFWETDAWKAVLARSVAWAGGK